MPSTPERFSITTAIDYPNGAPHMGHAYEKSVADFYARWYRRLGSETHFLTGLDEHGQKIEEAATTAGMTPQAFVDEKSGAFLDLCEKLSISNTDFIRTSEPRHHRFALEMYQRVRDNGDIYPGEYEGDYCVSCETFYTASQLADGKCPIHERAVEKVKEPSYFFRLGKYRDWIRGHIQENPDFIFPESRRNEILARLNDEVRDLSISRCTFDWGIPLPDDPKHVLYVWFDALSNYVSALKEPKDQYATFWPADMHVIGKDIIWFHTVIWPCMLHAAEMPLPRQVCVHGFVLDHEGRKMAKHLGNVVDPLDVVSKYGADVLRYYFLRAIASGQDGRFSEAEVVERHNSELGNDLGNLVMRVVKLVETKFDGKLEAEPTDEPDLDPAPVLDEFSRSVDRREHQRAMEALWAFVRTTNSYINDNAPWKETDAAKLHRVLYNALEALRGVTYMITPAMPAIASAMTEQLGFQVPDGPLAPFGRSAFSVKRADPLFPRIETKKKDAAQEGRTGKDSSQTSGQKTGKGAPSNAVDPFAKLDLRVGKIDDVQPHPEAEALWVLQVRLGDDEEAARTICAGLRKHVTAAELLGRKVMVVANLKPAKLRGIESRGMVLAADRADGKVIPVDPGDAPLGDQARIQGIEQRPKKKISSGDFKKAPLRTAGGVVVYDQKPLQTTAGPIQANAEDGAVVR